MSSPTKIDKLTPEQTRDLARFREECRAIGIRTGHDADCARLGREAVLEAHAEIGAKPPLVVWARSPLDALLKGDAITRALSSEEERVKLDAERPGDRLHKIWSQRWSWGQSSAYWLARFRFAIRLGVKVTDEQERRLRIHEKLAQACYGVISLGGIEILIAHPTVATFDTAGRLHRTDGPALAWSDGYAVWAIHGVRIEPKGVLATADDLCVRMTSGRLVAKEIAEHANAEVRRVLVDLYNAGDTGRYLRDLGAEVVHEDTDALGLPRRLLRIRQQGDEPIVAIEVTNSTPEPDGTHKKYTFRCHPELRPLPVPGIRESLGAPQEMTCQNAIASTYGYLGEDFALEMQT